MKRRDIRRAVAGGTRLVLTVVASSAITVTLMSVLSPQEARTESQPIVIVEGERLYPVAGGANPTITFESHEAFVEDYLALRREVLDLRHAIDYDASHGGRVGDSVHEWADGAKAGAYGGGRKP